MTEHQELHFMRYQRSNSSSTPPSSPKLGGTPFSLGRVSRKLSAPVRGATSPSSVGNTPFSAEVHFLRKTSIGSGLEYKEPLDRKRSLPQALLESAPTTEFESQNTNGENWSNRTGGQRHDFDHQDNRRSSKESDSSSSSDETPKKSETRGYVFRFDKNHQPEKIEEIESAANTSNENRYEVEDEEEQLDKLLSSFQSREVFIAEVDGGDASLNEQFIDSSFAVIPQRRSSSGGTCFLTLPSFAAIQNELNYWTTNNRKNRRQKLVQINIGSATSSDIAGFKSAMSKFRSLMIITGYVIFPPNKTPEALPEGSTLRVEFRDALQPEEVHGIATVDASYFREGAKLGYTIICRKPSFPGAYSVWGVLNVGWSPVGNEWIRGGDFMTRKEHLLTVDERGDYVMDLSLARVSPVGRRRKASEF